MRLKLTGLASCIGLSARQFGENLSKSMLEHVPVDLDVDPSEKAAEYIDNQQIYIVFLNFFIDLNFVLINYFSIIG